MARLTPATLTPEKMGGGMEGIGFRAPRLITVNAIPKARARKRAHCPDGETEAKLRKVDLCGNKADELRTTL